MSNDIQVTLNTVGGPEDYNFSSEYSVIVNHPIDEAFEVLGNGKGMAKVVGVSKLCSRFDLLESDFVRLESETSLLSHSVLGHNHPSASDVEITPGSKEGKSLPRQFFRLLETVPVLPGYKRTIEILGVQTYDEEAKQALYESQAEMGVSVWKLRVFERITDDTGKECTRVSEVIKGRCSPLLKFIVQKQTTTGHRAHMDTYHTLF